MNYEQNKITWKVGDFVLHDIDAKRPEMIMQVIGYQGNGLCKTVYFYTHEWDRICPTCGQTMKVSDKRKRVYKNDIKYLHPLGAFGISEPNKEGEREP
jgi:hypothetical protein